MHHRYESIAHCEFTEAHNIIATLSLNFAQQSRTTLVKPQQPTTPRKLAGLRSQHPECLNHLHLKAVT
jgi:hypothetical protein